MGASRSRSLVAILALALAITGCRPELIIRFASTVYPDGGLQRTVELTLIPVKEEADPADEPLGRGLTGIGADLPARDAWARVDEGPGWIRAEGFFAHVDDVPPLVEFGVDEEQGARAARVSAKLEIDERAVLKRWVWVESHGDPYTAAESARGLDGVTELAIEALRHEIERTLGPEIDTWPAEEFLRTEARSLAWAMLTVSRGSPGWDRVEARSRNWTQLLSQHGLPVIEGGAPEEFWAVQTPVLLDWLRTRVAQALSKPEAPVSPSALSFWPEGEDWEPQLTRLIERVWGSEDELYERIEPHLARMAGLYGGDDAPQVRFEARLRLPGTLVSTNGMPDGDSVVWSFRQNDLSLGDLMLRAVSVEIDREALTELGARRDFDRAALLRLSDILWARDPNGQLASLLSDAVTAGKLALLRDDDQVPPELAMLAGELADLLDPEVPLPEPL